MFIKCLMHIDQYLLVPPILRLQSSPTPFNASNSFLKAGKTDMSCLKAISEPNLWLSQYFHLLHVPSSPKCSLI